MSKDSVNATREYTETRATLCAGRTIFSVDISTTESIVSSTVLLHSDMMPSFSGCMLDEIASLHSSRVSARSYCKSYRDDRYD